MVESLVTVVWAFVIVLRILVNTCVVEVSVLVVKICDVEPVVVVVVVGLCVVVVLVELKVVWESHKTAVLEYVVILFRNEQLVILFTLKHN